MNDNKQHLIDQIDTLKTQIQDLIDLKKKTSESDTIKSLETDKKIKIAQVQALNSKLKEIQRKERQEQQKKNELRSISRAVDSLEFGAAKKKNNPLALDTAKKSKQLREDAKQKYLEYLEAEEKYLEKDPVDLPSYIFLHNRIQKEYGVCPYLNIDSEQTTDEIYNLRLTWLESQSDKGQLFFEMRDDIIHKKELDTLQNKKQEIEQQIDDFIKSHINDSLFDLYTQSEIFIKEFSQTAIKTKRLKERFRQIVHNLSILLAETGIEVQNYLGIKYNQQIDVNLIDFNDKKLVSQDKFQRVLLNDQLADYVELYKIIIEKMQLKQKYITNTLKNLKGQLYNFLSNKTKTTPEVYNQVGKYFKRWITLTQEEQLERFESFCIYYINKLGIDNLTLNDLVKDAFLTKKMVYRDYTWNATKGIIEKMKDWTPFFLAHKKKDDLADSFLQGIWFLQK
jgi:hypothetical protein